MYFKQNNIKELLCCTDGEIKGLDPRANYHGLKKQNAQAERELFSKKILLHRYIRKRKNVIFRQRGKGMSSSALNHTGHGLCRIMHTGIRTAI